MLAVSARGCSPSTTDQSVEGLRFGLAGTVVDTEHPAVVRVQLVYRDANRPPGSSADTIECSGTLISPRLVLTAAHCVLTSAVASSREFNVSVRTSATESLNVKVSRCWVHPLAIRSLARPGEYARTCEEPARVGSFDPLHDVAVLQLARRIAPDLADRPSPERVAPIAPIFSNPGGAAFTATGWNNVPMQFIGYGGERNRAIGARLRAEATLLGRAVDGPRGEPASFYDVRFATPRQSATTGDSGGPSLAVEWSHL